MRYEDRTEVCDRLAATFTATPRAEWVRIFDYEWPTTERPNYGLVAEQDGQILGCGCIAHSYRDIDGKRHWFANGLAWWVDPSRRGMMVGKRIIDAFFAMYADRTITILTYRRDHQKFWKHYPLVPFEERRIIVRPSASAALPSRLRVIANDDVTESLVGAEPFRIFREHIAQLCVPRVYSDGVSACVTISRRRVTDVPPPSWLSSLRSRSPAFERWISPIHGRQGWRRLVDWSRDIVGHRWPLAELMYVSDKAFARRWLGRIAANLAREHRALGLLVDERRVGLTPNGRRYLPGHYYFVSKELTAEHVDALYSEITILPM